MFRKTKSLKAISDIFIAGESGGKAMARIYGNIGFRGLWNGLPVRIVMVRFPTQVALRLIADKTQDWYTDGISMAYCTFIPISVMRIHTDMLNHSMTRSKLRLDFLLLAAIETRSYLRMHS